MNEGVNTTFDEPLIEERRLVGTMITGKPSASAYIVASVTILIMMIMTLFFWRGPEIWTDLLPAVNSQIFQHKQWWRIFTAMFVHSDLEHLFSNMYMLWIFTFFVFGYFGFSAFPVTSIVLSAVVNLVAVTTYSPNIELIGASGLVYILGGFWLTLYLFIQRQYSIINRFIRVLGIAFMIFWPSTFVATTSYRTHALGFAVGILMGAFYFYKNRTEIRSHEKYQISLV